MRYLLMIYVNESPKVPEDYAETVDRWLDSSPIITCLPPSRPIVCVASTGMQRRRIIIERPSTP